MKFVPKYVGHNSSSEGITVYLVPGIVYNSFFLLRKPSSSKSESFVLCWEALCISTRK